MQTATRRGAPIVLTFDRTDPTSAGGLQSDVLTAACLGCHPLSIATAITVQDTVGIARIDGLDAGHVAEQGRMLLADLAPDAIRVGFLASAAQVDAVRECATGARSAVLVIAAPFDRMDATTRAAVCAALFPESPVVVADARGLVALHAESDEATPEATPAPTLDDAIARTFAAGAMHVLLTGIDHETDGVLATLHGRDGVVCVERRARLPQSSARLAAPTLDDARDTLACALAALLANDLPVAEAARDAVEFTWQALAHGAAPGRGRAMPDRFFWARHLGSTEAA